MMWLSWRQTRRAALLVLVLTTALATVLALTGPHLADLARTTDSVYDLLTGGDRFLFYGGIGVLAVVPGLLGAFWGAPLVARELETGTNALIWSQSVSPTRWLLTKLAVVLGATVVLVGALSAAITWWSGPLDGAVSSTRGGLPSRLTPVSFAMRGSVPVGYAVLAVVLGVGLGLLIKRTLPAMALTLALMVAFQIAMPLWVRPHLAPAVEQNVVLSNDTLDGISADRAGDPVSITAHTSDRGDWVLINTTADADGRAALPAWLGSCFKANEAAQNQNQTQADKPDQCLARLTAEGYRQHLAYQPASHFWRLQITETALCLLLAALLAGLWTVIIRW